MTRAEVRAWLQQRMPAPPPALAEQLARAVSDSALPLPEHLAEQGRTLLAGVLAHPEGGRVLALQLLAADAFVTYACEAQAEADTFGLDALARKIAT
jgi:hypothetical protein